MGTPDFAVPALNVLLTTPGFEVAAVVTQEDKKTGRKQLLTPPPVKELALHHNIPVLQPGKIRDNKDFLKLLQQLEPDFIVVVAFGKILPKEILEIPKYASINIHGSLLPKYRGASPVEEALLHDDQETGITIMQMTEELDAGDIYLMKRIPIDPKDNAQTLRMKLSLIGAALLPETLKAISNHQLDPIPQNNSKATFCQKITKEDGLVTLKDFTAEEIVNRIRAYTPWPSCYMKIKGKQLKILEAEIDMERTVEPGKVIDLNKNSIGLGTKKGLLIPLKVQMEGKSPMPIETFLAGNRRIFD